MKKVYIKSSILNEVVLTNNSPNGLNIEVSYIRVLCPSRAAYDLNIKLQGKKDVIYIETEPIEAGGVYEGLILLIIPIGYSLIIQSTISADVYLTYDDEITRHPR